MSSRTASHHMHISNSFVAAGIPVLFCGLPPSRTTRHTETREVHCFMRGLQQTVLVDDSRQELVVVSADEFAATVAAASSYSKKGATVPCNHDTFGNAVGTYFLDRVPMASGESVLQVVAKHVKRLAVQCRHSSNEDNCSDFESRQHTDSNQLMAISGDCDAAIIATSVCPDEDVSNSSFADVIPSPEGACSERVQQFQLQQSQRFGQQQFSSHQQHLRDIEGIRRSSVRCGDILTVDSIRGVVFAGAAPIVLLGEHHDHWRTVCSWAQQQLQVAVIPSLTLQTSSPAGVTETALDYRGKILLSRLAIPRYIGGATDIVAHIDLCAAMHDRRIVGIAYRNFVLAAAPYRAQQQKQKQLSLLRECVQQCSPTAAAHVVSSSAADSLLLPGESIYGGSTDFPGVNCRKRSFELSPDDPTTPDVGDDEELLRRNFMPSSRRARVVAPASVAAAEAAEAMLVQRIELAFVKTLSALGGVCVFIVQLVSGSHELLNAAVFEAENVEENAKYGKHEQGGAEHFNSEKNSTDASDGLSIGCFLTTSQWKALLLEMDTDRLIGLQIRAVLGALLSLQSV
jgi:hypothetical protein